MYDRGIKELSPPGPGDADGTGQPSRVPGFLVMVVFLMLVWVGFSDKRDLFHLASGLGCSVLVAGLTQGTMVVGVRRTRRGSLRVRYIWSFPWRRLAIFLPWLLWKILVANAQVARMILHPRLPIDPSVIRVETGLRGDLARMALATVITLTPGTCVLDIEGDTFTVHRIHSSSSDDLLSNELVDMVRKTFEPEGWDVDAPAGEPGAKEEDRA